MTVLSAFNWCQLMICFVVIESTRLLPGVNQKAHFKRDFSTNHNSVLEYDSSKTPASLTIDCTKNKRPTDGTGCRVSKVIIAQKPRQLPALVLLMRLRSFNTSHVTYRPFKT